MKELSKKRPVVFFDLETTGKDKDTNEIRIIELSAIKYEDTENWKEIDRLETRFNNDDKEIQPDAIEVHHITHEMIKDLPSFQDRAQEIFDFFNGCDVGGYNNSFFDNSVLFYSFLRAGIKWDWRKLKVYDILNLYRKYHNAKLTSVYKLYTGKNLEDAHNASSDIEATIEVYKKMKEQNEDFEGEELDHYKYHLDMIGDFKWRLDKEGNVEPYYGFGAYNGKSIEEIGVGMLEWMIQKKSDKYPIDTIHAAKQLLDWLYNKIDNKNKEDEISNTKSKKWYE